MSTIWPELNYSHWKDTYQTLHRYLQIVGKLRLYKSPWLNHSWHATYYVNSRGLTTSAIPLGDRNLTIQFDFFDHALIFEDSFGTVIKLPLMSESVASFFSRFLSTLDQLGIEGYINDYPVECPDNIRFSQDTTRKTYNKEHVENFFQALVRVNNVFQQYRSEFTGKSSPVHLFWGSFDLAVTRFSGRAAPEHPGIAPYISPIVMKEAYSQEVCSCGFWPGNELYPHAIFYSYAYPEPPLFKESTLHPLESFYNKEMGEFMLHYDEVQKSSNPEKMLLTFMRSSYQKASELAAWDKEKLTEDQFWMHLSQKYRQTDIPLM